MRPKKYQPAGYTVPAKSAAIPLDYPDLTVSDAKAEPNNSKRKKAKQDRPKPSKENIDLYGMKKAQKIAAGKLAIEDGTEYNISLVKALCLTVWERCIKGAVFGFIHG
jgi:hypothetical protein